MAYQSCAYSIQPKEICMFISRFFRIIHGWELKLITVVGLETSVESHYWSILVSDSSCIYSKFGNTAFELRKMQVMGKFPRRHGVAHHCWRPFNPGIIEMVVVSLSVEPWFCCIRGSRCHENLDSGRLTWWYWIRGLSCILPGFQLSITVSSLVMITIHRGKAS